MNFGDALESLRAGKRMTRKGWNGKDQYVELQMPDKNSKMTLPYIYIKTVAGDLVPWLASQTDLLMDDWEISPVTDTKNRSFREILIECYGYDKCAPVIGATIPPKKEDSKVDKPSHYMDGRKYEPRLVAEDWNIIDNGYVYDAFCYIARAGRKLYPDMDSRESEILDLQKAIQNLQFRIDSLKNAKE